MSRAASGAARVLTDLAWVASGKLLGLISLLICSVLVARVAGPTEYGVYAAGLSLVMLVDALIGAAVDHGIVRFGALHRDDRERCERMQAAAVRLKAAAGIALLPVGALGGQWLGALLFGDSGRHQLVLVALGSACALLLVRGTGACLQVDLRFHAYAVLDTLLAILRVLAMGVLVLAGVRSASLFLGAYGTSAALTFVLTSRWLPYRYLLARPAGHHDGLALLAFVGAAAGVVALGTITARGDILLVSALRSAAETGYYGVAAQLSTIATMAAGYAGVITQPRIIPMARQGRLRELLWWSGIGAAVAGAVLITIAFPLVGALISNLFGADYTPAVPIFRVLLIGACADLLALPVLVPFVIQFFPRVALAAEATITLAFLILGPVVGATGPLAVAWLASVIRVVKLGFYAWLTLMNTGRAAQLTTEIAPDVPRELGHNASG